MSTEKSVRQVAEEWNAKAKAEGRLLEHDPWSLPSLYEGSILDVPVTPEAEERIRRLDETIARLKQQRSTGPVPEEQQDVRAKVQDLASPPAPSSTPSGNAPSVEQPPTS